MSRTRPLAHALSLLLFCSLLTPPAVSGADKLKEVLARGTLLCGVHDSVVPFGFQDQTSNSIKGFEVELCMAVASKLGVRLKLVPLAPADRLPLILQGGADLVAATMTHSYEQDEFIDFSITYFMDGQKLMTTATAGIPSVAGLKGKTVAAVRESRAVKTVAELQPGAQVLEYDTVAQAFLAVKNGEAEVVTADSVTLLGLRQVDENPDDWVLSEELLTREPYAMGMSENESDFRDAVNQALAELWTSGAYDDIYDTWFGPQSPYHVPLEWTMTVWP